MIVTRAARWLIALGLGAAIVGLARQDAFLTRLSVASLVWVGMEWLAFRYRVDFFLPSVVTTRDLRNREETTRVLWESRSVGVRTSLSFPSTSTWLPAVNGTVHDLVPTGVDALGEHGCSFSLGSDRDVILSYRIRPRSPGAIRFTGLRLVLHDQHGLFQSERFLYLPHHVRVLPLAMKVGTPSATRKHNNVLPPTGVHLMPKAGVGSELLEIRAYEPGDALRSIAWKVSARRDELMCKQFETEVPVRCQLFVDMSRSVRLGYPGPCMGGRMVSLAAVIAYTSSSHRDPVGLSIFDADDVMITKASANRKAVMRMIDQLTRSLDRPVELAGIPSKQLIRSAFDIACVRYPEAIEYAQRSLSGWLPRRPSWNVRLQVAAILCNHYQLDRFSMGELVDDEAVMSRWLQRFHSDHGASYTGSLLDRKGNYLLDDRSKVDQLGKLIRRAASRARGNELFVVMAELLDARYELEPLIRTIKFAKARGHRVVVLLAWPAELPIPKSASASDERSRMPTEPNALLMERRQNEAGFEQLRAELGRLGVPVVAAADEQAPPLILNQLGLVRSERFTA